MARTGNASKRPFVSANGSAVAAAYLLAVVSLFKPRYGWRSKLLNDAGLVSIAYLTQGRCGAVDRLLNGSIIR